MSKYVLVVNDRADMGASYYLPFSDIGPCIDEISILETDPKLVKLVVFTGGSDVHPMLYKEDVSSRTFVDVSRDIDDVTAFRAAKQHDIPMFGICRGFQFLNVMANGKMYQHVEGHHSGHHVELFDGRDMFVSSSHHQMVRPNKHCAKVIGWSRENLSRVYIIDMDIEARPPKKEVEVLAFTSFRGAGVQYHPEIMSDCSPGYRYVFELLDKYCFEKRQD